MDINTQSRDLFMTNFDVIHVIFWKCFHYVQNLITFLKIWEMVKMIKTDVDRLLLGWKIKKSSILVKSIGKIVFFIKTNISLSAFIFIFSTICQIFILFYT